MERALHLAAGDIQPDERHASRTDTSEALLTSSADDAAARECSRGSKSILQATPQEAAACEVCAPLAAGSGPSDMLTSEGHSAGAPVSEGGTRLEDNSQGASLLASDTRVAKRARRNMSGEANRRGVADVDSQCKVFEWAERASQRARAISPRAAATLARAPPVRLSRTSVVAPATKRRHELTSLDSLGVRIESPIFNNPRRKSPSVRHTPEAFSPSWPFRRVLRLKALQLLPSSLRLLVMSFFGLPTLAEDWEVAEVLSRLRRQGGESLRSLQSRFHADREVVISAVCLYGPALAYADVSLRGDRQVVAAAVQSDGMALRHATRALRGDRELVLIAVEKWGGALSCALPVFHDDRQIISVAVAQAGSSLQFASLRLRSDQELVLVAVMNDGMALQHAAPALCADRDIVLAAVRAHGQALQYASGPLRSTLDVVAAAVAQSGYALRWAGDGFRDDWRLRQLALKQLRETNQYRLIKCLLTDLDDERQWSLFRPALRTQRAPP